MELQIKDQTSIEISNQIRKLPHELETSIAKKKSKSLNISIPIINKYIKTPILKNT